MARAYITEHPVNNLGFFAPAMPPLASQAVTYTAAAQSSFFGGGTSLIAFSADAAAHVAFGTNPTATTNDFRVPANTVVYFHVVPGQRMSVYDGTT